MLRLAAPLLSVLLCQPAWAGCSITVPVSDSVAGRAPPTSTACPGTHSTSASNRVLTAMIDAQAASYLAAGPVFVGESLVKPQFLPSGQMLEH